MTEEDYISFETLDYGETIHLYGDEKGLKRFANKILNLIENTKDGYFEHDHFMSKEWGDDFLESEKWSEDGIVVTHLKAYCFKGDEMQI